jgi:transketolase
MRVTFAETLAELAVADRRIVLLTGDLGFMALDAFIDRHPDRFFNVGVAEQNMVGLATGLAEAGFIPFVYSIVPFAVFRPFEFIRNGPVQHGLPVRIVGVGAGFDYGTNGLSHYGLDDLSVMRTHRRLTVLAPADFRQARTILLTTWKNPGPIYYRLGKDQSTEVPGLEGQFVWNEPIVLRRGSSILLVTTSSISADANLVAERLQQMGISATLAIVAQINPPPTDALAEMMSSFSLVATIENHFQSGGLGSMVAEIIADQGLGCRLLRFGASEDFEGRSGSTAFMHGLAGISVPAISEAILKSWTAKDR